MASGFMEGFGEAFANSWNTGMQAREQRKNDEFRLTYDQYLKNKDTVAKQKAEDAKNLKLANSVLEGIPNAPKSALANIYNDLQAGMSVEAVNKKYENGEWSEVDSRPTAAQTSQTGSQGPVQAPDPKDGAVKVNTSAAPAGTFPTPGLAPRGEGGGMESAKPVDTEMQGSGMAGASPDAPAPAPQEAAPKPEGGGVKFNNLLSGLSGKFNTSTAQGNNAPTRAQQRIAKMTNQTPEQVAQTMQSAHTPQSMPTTAQFKARAVQKADPISNLNEAMIEEKQAQVELQRNNTPDNQRRMEAATNRVASIKTAISFERETAAAAKAKAEGLGPDYKAAETAVVALPSGKFEVVSVRMSPDGPRNDLSDEPINGRIIRYSDDEKKLLLDVAKAYDVGMREYQEASAKVPSMLRNSAILVDLAQDPNVLHGGISSLAQIATQAQGELQGAISLLNKDVITPEDIAKFEGDYKATLDNISKSGVLPSSITDLAQKKTLFDATRLQLALDMAAANGQSGQNLSNKELDNYLNNLNGKDATSLATNLATQVDGYLNKLRDGSSLVGQFNSSLKAFEQFSRGKPSGFEPINPNIDEVIANSNDPWTQRGSTLIRDYGYGRGGRAAVGQQGTGTQPASQPSAPNQSRMIRINSPQEAAQLKSGTTFIDPQGNIRQVP